MEQGDSLGISNPEEDTQEKTDTGKIRKTKPIQARKLRLKFGKATVRSNAETIAKRILIINDAIFSLA
ncbi:MAG: hypothetical protein ABSH06_32350 [Thermodesulfobacteriota bacterium]